VLRVDERGDPSLTLRLGDDVQANRRLARAFRPEDLDDPPARYATDPERDVERQRPVGMVCISTFIGCSPSFMTAPRPCCFSICWSVTSRILSRSTRSPFPSRPTPEEVRASAPA
jgi:hypothetical protein